MPAPETTAGIPRVRILVIDDNRDAADSLALLLKIWGFDVRAVYNGGDALPTARDFKPDAVVSDIQLPGINGYRLAELFRQDDSFKHIPLIAISAAYEPERARSAGFDHDLTKPADPTILLHFLTRLLLMDKRLERADDIIQKQGEIVEQARDLVSEVKSEVQEMKQELKEVKEDVQEIKEKLAEHDNKPPNE